MVAYNMKVSVWVDADQALCPDTRRWRGDARWRGNQLVFAGAENNLDSDVRIGVHVAMAEIVNEPRFLRQVKAFMVPPIDYNICVHEDNEGAIKMSEDRLKQPIMLIEDRLFDRG